MAQPPAYCWLPSQDICLEYGIPTAHSQCFSDAAAAKEYIRCQGVPIVVKADGLAAGKGVVVAHDEQAALAAVDAILVERRFGDAGPPAAQHACPVPAEQLPTLWENRAGLLRDAGNEVVIEEFLEGEEASFFALVDGTTCVALASAQVAAAQA